MYMYVYMCVWDRKFVGGEEMDQGQRNITLDEMKHEGG